jgi:hypothetical protein
VAPDDDPNSITGLEGEVAGRILAELGEEAGERVITCLGTAEEFLDCGAADERGLRFAESAIYNVREALDAVVSGTPARGGGLDAAIKAWERYKLASAQPGADETAARSDLAAVLDDLARDGDRQGFMLRKLLAWFRAQTGVEPLPGDTDPARQFEDLRKRASKALHASSPLGQAEALFAETVAWFVRMFTPPSEQLERLAQLASSTFSTDNLAEFQRLATSAHHVRLFLGRVEDAAWLVPLRRAGIIALPKRGELWPVGALAGKDHQLADSIVVELLEDLLREVRKSVPKPERPSAAFEIMRTASWLGPAGHPVILQVVKAYPADEWTQMIAISATKDVDDADPIHVDVARAVMGNLPRRGGDHRLRQVLQPVVGGITIDNFEQRFKVVAHGTKYLAARPEARFVTPDIVTLTTDGWEDDEPLAIALRALVNLIPTAFTFGMSTEAVRALVEQIPDEWGQRAVCHVLAFAPDVDRASRLAHLIIRLDSVTATGDDRLLLTSLLPLSEDETRILREALGEPAAPPSESDAFGDNWARAWRWSMLLPAAILDGWDESIAAVSQVHGPPDLTALDRPTPTSIARPGSSPFDTDDLARRDPLDAAGIIAAWRPDPSDIWGTCARELARTLESIVAEAPSAWVTDPVAVVGTLREPVYIDHYFRALKTTATTVADRAPAIIEAIRVVRSERWRPTELGRDDFEYEPTWTIVDTVSVELIDALADAEADLAADLDYCWAIATQAVVALPDDLGDEDRYIDPDRHDDPLNGAINSSYGRGLQAVLALGGWEHRNQGAARAELAEILSSTLAVGGAVGLQLRSALAASRPFVEAIVTDWIDENFDGLFSHDRAGRITLDQSLKYSRPTKFLYERSVDRLVAAARRGAEHAVAWLLIGHLWQEPDYTYDRIVDAFAGNREVLAEVCREIARLGSNVSDDQVDVTDRAVAFSHRLLTEPPKRLPTSALVGLGQWSLGDRLDNSTWLDLTERAVELTGGDMYCAFEIANRCRDLQPSKQGLRILTAMLGHGEPWDQDHIDRIAVESLRNAIEGKVADPAVDELRERLIQRGRYDA